MVREVANIKLPAHIFRLFTWALLIYLISALVGIFVTSAFSVLPLGVSITMARVIPPVVIVLALSYAILFLLGYSSQYQHRTEFGPAQERNLEKSVVLLIASAAVIVSRVAVLGFALPLLGLLGPGSPLEEHLVLISAAVQVLAILEKLLLALLLYYLIVAYLSRKQLSHMRFAMALYVLGPLVSSVLFMLNYIIGDLLTQHPWALYWSVYAPSISFTALRAVGAFLFWSIYRSTYVAMRNTILQTGG